MTWVITERKISGMRTFGLYWHGSRWVPAQSLACHYTTREEARDVARSLASARVVRLVPGPRVRELLAERDAAVAVADRQRDRAKAVDLGRLATRIEIDRLRAEVKRLASHVEELQAEALGITDGAPPEGTTTVQAILAIRETRARAGRVSECE